MLVSYSSVSSGPKRRDIELHTVCGRCGPELFIGITELATILVENS